MLTLTGDTDLRRKLERLKTTDAKAACRKGCRAGAKMLAADIKAALPQGNDQNRSAVELAIRQARITEALAKASTKSKTKRGQEAAAKIIAEAMAGETRRSVKVKAMKRSRNRVGSRVVVDPKKPNGMPYAQFGEYGTKKEKAKHYQREAVGKSGETVMKRTTEAIAAEIERRAARG